MQNAFQNWCSCNKKHSKSIWISFSFPSEQSDGRERYFVFMFYPFLPNIHDHCIFGVTVTLSVACQFHYLAGFIWKSGVSLWSRAGSPFVCSFCKSWVVHLFCHSEVLLFIYIFRAEFCVSITLWDTTTGTSFLFTIICFSTNQVRLWGTLSAF